MKKGVIIFCLLIFSVLSADAFGMKSTMNRLMDSWMGENINTVIDTWGYPSDVKDILGRKVFYWTHNEVFVTGNGYSTVGGEAFCNRIFEVDDANNIIKWQWEGNNCYCTYHGVKKYLNPKHNYWKDKKIQKDNK